MLNVIIWEKFVFMETIFSDIDVTVGSLDVETCHRTDLSAKNKSKIIIVRLFNRT